MTQLVIEAIALLTICLGLLLVIACFVAPGVTAVRSIGHVNEDEPHPASPAEPHRKRMSA